MKKKIVLAACICAAILGGCTVNVNELAKSSASDTQTELSTDSDTETRSNPFVMTDTETDEETDTYSNTDVQENTSSVAVFDESKYESKYVSGAAEIILTADALYGSQEVGRIASGGKVSVVHSGVKEYSFVYSTALETFGYVQSIYLADSPEEATIGELNYIKPSEAIIYADAGQTVPAAAAVQNEAVTVIVRRSDGAYLVMNSSGTAGYIDKSYLSDKKIKIESSKAESSKKAKSDKNSQGKNESKTEIKTESKVETQVESKAASKIESQIESKTEVSSEEEETVSALYSGKGEAPESYEVYICDVDEGYLALRSAPSRTKSKVIGEVYYEEQIYVIDASGEYWYVYIPSSGMYGYVTGNTDYLYPEEWYD